MAESEGHRLTVEAIRIIAENGGSIGRSALLAAVEQEVPEERREEKELSGRPRWVGQLDYYAARFAKRIIGKDKASRSWFLTDEGEGLAYDEQGKVLSLGKIGERFKESLGDDSPLDAASAGQAEAPAEASAKGEESQEQLEDDLAKYIKKQDPKNTGVWFENLTVALLRGMGYQYVRSCGKSGDGGVDVIAYKDKLGAMLPRIKVQTKHYKKGERPAPVSEEVLQRLASSVHSGEIGMCVTSSSFTKNAQIFARTCDKHLELVDLDRLVALWTEHYPYMTEEDKSQLPLKYTLDISKTGDKPYAAD